MRILHYEGPDEPNEVDPHWHFEHAPGELFVRDALRLWRTRLILGGTDTLEVRPRLLRLAGQHTTEIATKDHIFQYTGWEPFDESAYEVIGAGIIEATPPVVVLAIELTDLPPGDYRVEADVAGIDDPIEALAFTIERRPIFTFASGRAAAKSATGLREVEIGRCKFATAHSWRVIPHLWPDNEPPGKAYEPEGALTVTAVTLFRENMKPVMTRYRLMDPGELEDGFPLDLTEWNEPREHALPPRGPHEETRFGLPFPNLIGLPRQPEADGSYRSAPVSSDAQP